MRNNQKIGVWLIAGIFFTANIPSLLEQTFAQTNINYQSIGSGGGVKQFIEKTVDFGATDAPLNKEEEKKAIDAVHIPETIGSVVLAYNLPQIADKELKLTGPIIADIFMGKITKWDDPKIKEINSGLELPSEDIVVVHRSD